VKKIFFGNFQPPSGDYYSPAIAIWCITFANSAATSGREN
jgi:hypothetical protein